MSDPREDGICIDCLGKPAVTRDGLYCLKCLRKRIADDNPLTYGGRTEAAGRKARSSKDLGGVPWMGEGEDE